MLRIAWRGAARLDGGRVSRGKRDDETRVLNALIDYFRQIGRGQWCVEAEPDPPDFVIRRRASRQRAAVEVTQFFWPRQIANWQWALRGLMKRVSNLIAGKVKAQFLLSIDVRNQQSFSAHYKALSRGGRARAASRLAQQIVTQGPNITTGDAEPIPGPPAGLLIKLGDSPTGACTWGSNVWVGDNLQDVAVEMQRVVDRKASSLQRFKGGPRILIIEYLCGLNTSLEVIAGNVSLPAGVDELYYLVPGGQVRNHSSLRARS